MKIPSYKNSISATSSLKRSSSFSVGYFLIYWINPPEADKHHVNPVIPSNVFLPVKCYQISNSQFQVSSFKFPSFSPPVSSFEFQVSLFPQFQVFLKNKDEVSDYPKNIILSEQKVENALLIRQGFRGNNTFPGRIRHFLTNTRINYSPFTRIWIRSLARNVKRIALQAISIASIAARL